MSEATTQVSPPYLSYVTFRNTIQSLALDGKMPRQIDHSVLGTLSGSIRKSFMASLRFFNLVDDSGKPTERLQKLATADDKKWKEFMGVLLTEHYPEQIDQLADASGTLVRERFTKSFASLGGSIVQPALRFLIASAKDCGLEVSSYLGQRKVRTASGVRRKARKETRQAVSPEMDEQPEPKARSESSFRAALLQKFPNFDPSWGSEQQQAWFIAYEKLLGMHKGENGD